jgi:uncharacterized membrane protein YdbT with pleckstrin-like domain
MEHTRLVLRPSLVNAILPRYFQWLKRYTVASFVAYAVFFALDALGLFLINHRTLLWALVIVSVWMSFVSVKHLIIALHRTTYTFLDTHVTARSGILMTHRQSMPYNQIQKITNDASLWDRMTNASDITLHGIRGHDLLLRSIKNSEDVEERIYSVLRGKKESQKQDED